MASASNYLKRRHRHHNANEMHRAVQRHWYWWCTGARSALLRSSHYLRTTLSGVGGRADERVRCALRGHGICAPPPVGAAPAPAWWRDDTGAEHDPLPSRLSVTTADRCSKTTFH